VSALGRPAYRRARAQAASVGLSLTAALAGRAEQEDNEPDRHGHQCAQQQIRRGPGEAFLGIVLNALSRKPRRVHQLVNGHAEMGQYHSHHQRGDNDFGQCPQRSVKHPRPAARRQRSAE
jgi:hypothetical protein